MGNTVVKFEVTNNQIQLYFPDAMIILFDDKINKKFDIIYSSEFKDKMYKNLRIEKEYTIFGCSEQIVKYLRNNSNGVYFDNLKDVTKEHCKKLNNSYEILTLIDDIIAARMK